MALKECRRRGDSQGDGRIFDLVLAVASGRRFKPEVLGSGSREFTPWQIGAVM